MGHSFINKNTSEVTSGVPSSLGVCAQLRQAACLKDRSVGQRLKA